MSWFTRWLEDTFDPWPGGTKHDWQTWLNHALVCAAACFPFAVIRVFGGPDLVGFVATVALAFYVVKEVRDGWKGLDTIGDITGPLLVCLMAWLIGG